MGISHISNGLQRLGYCVSISRECLFTFYLEKQNCGNKQTMYLGNLVGEGGVFAMIVNILTVSIILLRMLIHYRGSGRPWLTFFLMPRNF